MSFYSGPGDIPDISVIEDAKSTVKNAPLTYSDPVEVLKSDGDMPKISDEPFLSRDIVDYLNGDGSSSISIFTTFANGNVSNPNAEKQTYTLKESFEVNGDKFKSGFATKLRNMYATITMICSRSHLIGIALNNVPQSYYFSNLYKPSGYTIRRSMNLYKRMYITDCVEFSSARTGLFRMTTTTLKASYCAIVTIYPEIGDDDDVDYKTITRIVISTDVMSGKIQKMNVDNLLKNEIQPAIKNALEEVFEHRTNESFSNLYTLKDVGLISMRMSLDELGNTEEVTSENSGKYLKVVSMDYNNIITPLIAMMMASHAGDEHLDDIVNTKAQMWIEGLDDVNAWYYLVTSMMLNGLSPFSEYSSDKVNVPIEASLLSYDEQEKLKEILKM